MKYLYSIVAFLLLVSCSKEVEDAMFEAYAPSKIDVNGGSWKTFILTSPTEVSVAVPYLTSDAKYIREIDSLKSIVIPKLTTAQKEAVKFWGAGSVLRWNEIGRELAARYNLPPASNAAGVYPVPDPANPLADPKFPFANPPYTARALAYLSIAQYDALVSAWKYKYQYNRKAPYEVDASIKPLLPVTSMPSYPS